MFYRNILGDVFIYQATNNIINKKKESNKDCNINTFFDKKNKIYNDLKKNQDKIVYNFKKESNPDEKLLIQLNDHYKEIKYMDYNPRLNLFLSYGLDGYIHIYVFPECKLIRTIKVKDITKSNDILQKVVLISIPFPTIFFHDSHYMYSLTINGDLIKKTEKKNNSKIFACVDKNLGFGGDSLFTIIFDNVEKGNEKIEIKSLTLPYFELENA